MLHDARKWSCGAALAVLAAAGTGRLAAAGPVSNTDEVLRAVVGVETEVPPGARSAPALGTRRSGSGVVIDASGLVVTVGYLVLEASRATLVVSPGRRVPATVVGYDHDSGFGLLRAEEPLDVRPVALGESAALAPGNPVLIASRGGRDAVQPAVLVSRRPFAGYWEYLLEDAMYVAPAHSLFGGAALLDGTGRLLGIGSLTVSDALPGPRAMPGNVFIPVDLLKEILGDMLADGRSMAARRPWIGVYADDARGPVTVREVARDGPAAAAGVAPGDVVIGVGEQPVTSLDGFYRALWASGDAGDAVALTVLRANALRQVRVLSIDRYDWLRLSPADR